MESTLRSLKQESYIEGWNDAREAIAKEIMDAHDGSNPMAKCYDIGCLDVVCSHEEDAAIARGQK